MTKTCQFAMGHALLEDIKGTKDIKVIKDTKDIKGTKATKGIRGIKATKGTGTKGIKDCLLYLKE